MNPSNEKIGRGWRLNPSYEKIGQIEDVLFGRRDGAFYVGVETPSAGSRAREG